MQQEINLYALLPKETVSYFQLKNILVWYAVFVSFLLLLDCVLEFQKIHLKKQSALLSLDIQTKQQQLNSLTQQYPVSNPVELDKQLKKLEADYQQTTATIDLLSPYAHFSSYLLGLAKTAVPGVWLTEMSFSRNDNIISLKGYTVNPAMLEQFYTALTKEPAFAGMLFELKGIQETTFPPSFTIEAKETNQA